MLPLIAFFIFLPYIVFSVISGLLEKKALRNLMSVIALAPIALICLVFLLCLDESEVQSIIFFAFCVSIHILIRFVLYRILTMK